MSVQILKKSRRRKPPKSVTIIGRRWFQRTYGNTYFSAVGIVDGVEVVRIPYEYWYEDHYADRITQELDKAGHLPGLIHHEYGSEPLWQYRDRTGTKFTYSVSDVSRERDL